MKTTEITGLCIGIGKKGRNDAIAWADMLKAQGQSSIVLLTDEEATSKRINATFKKMAEVGRSTAVNLYFSGPGGTFV